VSRDRVIIVVVIIAVGVMAVCDCIHVVMCGVIVPLIVDVMMFCAVGNGESLAEKNIMCDARL